MLIGYASGLNMKELDFIKLCRQKIAEYYHLKEYKAFLTAK